MILLIDNYDSFVYNLARYLAELGHETMVVRHDAITLAEIAAIMPSQIVISPGPCTPDEAGISIKVVTEFARSIPILGVCLGHQAIAVAFGGRVIRAQQPMHGKASMIQHQDHGLFQGLDSSFKAARYHSLIVEQASLPTCLDVIAETEDGTIMGLAHQQYPTYGVQFHPESILTDCGKLILSNFINR